MGFMLKGSLLDCKLHKFRLPHRLKQRYTLFHRSYKDDAWAKPPVAGAVESIDTNRGQYIFQSMN